MNQPTPSLSATSTDTSHILRVALLFFLSGVPALMYQVVWQIALFRIFGVNIESVTIVVAAFMVGLGVGSLIGGQLSRHRSIAPLLLLGGIEIATGVFGLFSLRLFDWVGAATLGSSLPVTAATALALVLVPTLLMGATLPILVAELMRRSCGVGHAVGLLYSVNTLGAALAAVLIAPALLAASGMQASVWAATAINFVVGSGALWLHFRSGGASAVRVNADDRAGLAPSDLRYGAVLALGFMSGFISLSYEIVLYRIYSLTTAGMAWSFPIMLGMFLLGIALGSLLVSRWVASPGGRNLAFNRIAWMVLAASAVALLLLPAVIALSHALLAPPAELLLVLVIAALWGGVLPLLAESGIAADTLAGARVGGLYLANIAGSLVGTLGTGFVLMDYLGIRELVELFCVLGAVSALLFAFSFPVGTVVRRGVFAALAALMLVLPVHHQLTANVAGAIVFHNPESTPRHQFENKSGVVLVDQAGIVYGHGAYDGSFNTDILNQQNIIIRPYLLGMFHPHPRHVFMAGLSSGSWAQVIANTPGVESLTIAEINDAYTSLVSLEPTSRSLLTNPKVTIVHDDARRWLLRHPEARFDALVMNATYHFRANASNLLSHEFHQIAKQHMEPAGVFMFNSTGSPRVKATACQDFADGVIVKNFVVVSDKPLNTDISRWRGVLGAMSIDGKPVLGPGDQPALERVMGSELSGNWMSCKELLATAEDHTPISDDNRGAEWRSLFGWNY